jgi:hypothetical protein
MSKLTVDSVVALITEKIAVEVAQRYPDSHCTKLSPDTAEALAMDFGLLQALRGREGGSHPTDKGLLFAGVDVEAYKAQQAHDKQVLSLQRKKENLEKKLKILKEASVLPPPPAPFAALVEAAKEALALQEPIEVITVQ